MQISNKKEVFIINDGKVFENAWKKSVDKAGYFYHRLKDSAQSFGGGNNLRFSLKNPYDNIMFAKRYLFTLELKSTKGTSLSFWRDDFEDKTKSQTFLLHKHQIFGLVQADKFAEVVSGFIINFRETTNHTYFWHINDFLEYTNKLDKKSFNESDVINGNGLLIKQTLKKVNYEYDVNNFVVDCVKKYMSTTSHAKAWQISC